MKISNVSHGRAARVATLLAVSAFPAFFSAAHAGAATLTVGFSNTGTDSYAQNFNFVGSSITREGGTITQNNVNQNLVVAAANSTSTYLGMIAFHRPSEATTTFSGSLRTFSMSADVTLSLPGQSFGLFVGTPNAGSNAGTNNPGDDPLGLINVNDSSTVVAGHTAGNDLLRIASSGNFNFSGNAGGSSLGFVSSSNTAITIGSAFRVTLSGAPASTAGQTLLTLSAGLIGGPNLITTNTSSFTFVVPSNYQAGLRLNTGLGGSVIVDNFSFFDGEPNQPTWNTSGSGEWTTASNWSLGTTFTVPNAVGATALLGSVNTAARSVFTVVPITVGTLIFDSANTYAIGGNGSLTLDVASGNASLTVLQGSHRLALPVTLNDSTTVSVAASGTLTVAAPLTLAAGITVTKAGTGTLSIQAPVVLAGPATLLLKGGTVNNDFPVVGGNLTVSVDPATYNVGADQALAALSMELGGNTVNIGKSSSGATVPANVTAGVFSVTGGTGNTLNTTAQGNTLTASTMHIDQVSDLAKTGSGLLEVGRISGRGALFVNEGAVRIGQGLTASELGSLTVSSDGTLDLTNNVLVVRDGDLAGLTQAVLAGIARPGTGLRSSLTNAYTTVGVRGNDIGNGLLYKSLGDVTDLSSSDVIARYTYIGDTNLDGVVDTIDLAAVRTGLDNGLTGWQWGDVDYSGGPVSATDYAIVLNVYNRNLPSLGLPSGGNAIPEPGAAFGLLGLLSAGMLNRRRR